MNKNVKPGQVWQDCDTKMPFPYAKIVEVLDSAAIAHQCTEKGKVLNHEEITIPFSMMYCQGPGWQLGWQLYSECNNGEINRVQWPLRCKREDLIRLHFVAQMLGYTIESIGEDQDKISPIFMGDLYVTGNGVTNKPWNPLKSNGDALLLAIQLYERYGFHSLTWNSKDNKTQVFADKTVGFGSTTEEKTRGAIFFAAVAIYRKLEDQTK